VIGEAANGQEAVVGVIALRPDVILMDLVMPEMDDIAAIHAIIERAFMQSLLRESKNVLLILTADHGQTHVDPHTTLYLNRDPRLKRFQLHNRK